MSFSEGFSCKETIELSELYKEMSEIKKQLHVCEKDVLVHLDNVQERLEEQPKRNKKHISMINAIKYDLNSIEQTFNIITNELGSAENSYDELVEELNEVNSSLSLVHLVCEIHERLSLLKSLISAEIDYRQVFDILRTLDALIKLITLGEKITFIEDLRKMVSKEINDINELFKRQFQNNCISLSEKTSSTLKISENTTLLNSLLPVIYENKSTLELLATLRNFIWEKLFLLGIRHKCKIFVETDSNFVILRIDASETYINENYEDIFRNMISITQFLVKTLNCLIQDDYNLLNYIGSSIRSSLVETLFQESIVQLIPSEWKKIENFKFDLLKSTELLKKELKPLGFTDTDWEKINQVDKYYSQKRCQYLEDKAREIMKKDLHAMIEVGKPYDSRNPLTNESELLCCSISSYIPELTKLGEDLVVEIIDGSIENQRALFTTYKGVFFNYADFVAAHHQKLLETIPQQVALFFNNCMYLFLQLRKWDEMFESQKSLQIFYDDSAKAFYQVEEVGRTFFNSFVDDQKKQIEIILRETNLWDMKTLEILNEKTEKLFRQCLRQQELLKTVWSKVLSYLVYNETIGDIFNSMCNFIIDSLVTVEDISAAVAENLIEIFKIILNRGPKLFIDPNEISLYVSHWNKFNELNFVLGSSLLDISDRWADGKGPLALHFNPYELKQLIRALFQNSERRAAVLAKIHE